MASPRLFPKGRPFPSLSHVETFAARPTHRTPRETLPKGATPLGHIRRKPGLHPSCNIGHICAEHTEPPAPLFRRKEQPPPERPKTRIYWRKENIYYFRASVHSLTFASTRKILETTQVYLFLYLFGFYPKQFEINYFITFAPHAMCRKGVLALLEIQGSLSRKGVGVMWDGLSKRKNKERWRSLARREEDQANILADIETHHTAENLAFSTSITFITSSANSVSYAGPKNAKRGDRKRAAPF